MKISAVGRRGGGDTPLSASPSSSSCESGICESSADAGCVGMNLRAPPTPRGKFVSSIFGCGECGLQKNNQQV
jgi:hypothetical protein